MTDMELNATGVSDARSMEVSYIHDKGLVHCDLKPENILISDAGKAILIDFGLAINQGSKTTGQELLEAGLLIGTVIYLSPERVERKDFDARSDLYALGCILFEVIVGQSPIFYPETEVLLGEIVPRRITRPSQYVVDVPPQLDDLVARLLSRNPRGYRVLLRQ